LPLAGACRSALDNLRLISGSLGLHWPIDSLVEAAVVTEYAPRSREHAGSLSTSRLWGRFASLDRDKGSRRNTSRSSKPGLVNPSKALAARIFEA